MEFCILDRSCKARALAAYCCEWPRLECSLRQSLNPCWRHLVLQVEKSCRTTGSRYRIFESSVLGPLVTKGRNGDDTEELDHGGVIKTGEVVVQLVEIKDTEYCGDSIE